MHIVELIFLFLAYTILVATIIMQIVCYRKEIEFKETIFFSLSFLLLLISFIISAIYDLLEIPPPEFVDVLLYVSSLIIAVTTPVNIHTERIVKTPGLKNRIILITALLLAILYPLSYLLNYTDVYEIVILVFVNASIIYSMSVIIRSKISLLIVHREKVEKRIAKVLMIVLPLYAGIAFLNHQFQLFSVSLLRGSIFLSIIAIALAISKLLDDIRRLSMFVPENNLRQDKMDYYNITKREQEVLNLLIKGSRYREIGEKLFISVPTVKTHVANIYEKMSVNNKVELINLLMPQAV